MAIRQPLAAVFPRIGCRLFRIWQSMRDWRNIITPWSYAIAALVLSPVAAAMGGVLGSGAEVVTLVVLAVPTSLAALSGQRWPAVCTTFVAAGGCMLEGVAGWAHGGVSANWGFVALSIGLLIALSGTILAVVEPLAFDLQQLSQRTQFHMRDLYHELNHRPAAMGRVESPRKRPPADPVPPVDETQRLLDLRDAGRLITQRFELESLIPAVLTTTQQLLGLRSGDCQIYLWDARTHALKLAPAVPRGERRGGFVPNPEIGITQWVVINRQIASRADFERSAGLRPLLDLEPDFPDVLAPLLAGDELLGFMVLSCETTGPVRDVLLQLHLLQVGLAIKNAQLVERLQQQDRYDPLTGLLQHTPFQQQAAQCFETTVAENQPLTIVLADLDHFRSLNEAYGPAAGDHVLREFSRLWRAALPESALCGRLAGGRLAGVLTNCDLLQGAELAESLKMELATFPLFFGGQELRVTASFGVAAWRPECGNAGELLQWADDAMHRAKSQGRNQIGVHEESIAMLMPQ